MDDDSTWMFDFLMNLFESPEWEVPIMTFIDDNCMLFDNEEENKFEYTEIHGQFQELVDNILEEHLAEIGVDAELFAATCDSCVQSNAVSKEVLGQILAMDDFVTFKKLMVKRNMELELEVLQELKNEASMMSNDESKTNCESKSYDGDVDEDMDMDEHLLEMEVRYQQEEFEQADLETAIAMSLAIEDARVRQEAKDTEETKSSHRTDQLDEKCKQSRKELKEQRARHQELKETAQVTDDDMERRKKHLRQQRDRLMAKKKKDRERKLDEYKEAKEPPKEPPAQFADATSADAKQSAEDERRTALRIALARRMKEDLIQSEDSQSAMAAVRPFEDLDAKLQQVEMLRRENRKQERMAYESIMQVIHGNKNKK